MIKSHEFENRELDDQIRAICRNVVINTLVKTADYNVMFTDSVILIDATGSNVNINLPAPQIQRGRIFYVKAIDITNTATITTTGTIEGAASYTFQAANECLMLASDGISDYKIISEANYGVLLSDVIINTDKDWQDYAITNMKSLAIGKDNADRVLDVFENNGDPQARLTYTDDSVYTDIETDASGYLEITPTGGRVGVGATPPEATLHIKNSGTTTFLIDSGTTTTGFQFVTRASTSDQKFIDYSIGEYELIQGFVDDAYLNRENFFRAIRAGYTVDRVLIENGKIGFLTSVNNLLDFEVAGSKGEKITTVSSATYTITIHDRVISVTYTSTAPVDLTLPSASACWNSTDNVGAVFLVKDTGANAGTNNITINAAGSDTIIDSATGQTSTTIGSNGGALWLQANGASSYIVY